MLNVEKDPMNIFLANVKKYRFIAHRLGFKMEGYPENSFDNLKSIFNNKEKLDLIDGIEFDIQFTKDNIPVVIHDSTTADLSDEAKVVRQSTFDELKDINCGFRKSSYQDNIPWNQNKNFKLQTLDALFGFLMDYRSTLGNIIIKMETKSPILRKQDFVVLADILKKYIELRDNIMHISFFPWNLQHLKENQVIPTRTEQLIDFAIEKPITKWWALDIDGISLGLKNQRVKGNMELDKKAKLYSWFDSSLYQSRNAVSEKWVSEIIKNYGYIGLYTINTSADVEEMLSRISPEFLGEYADKFVITSDNPLYFKEQSLTLQKKEQTIC